MHAVMGNERQKVLFCSITEPLNLTFLYFAPSPSHKIHQKNVMKVLSFEPFYSQDLSRNSPYCLLYNSHDASLENLVLNQLKIP